MVVTSDTAKFFADAGQLGFQMHHFFLQFFDGGLRVHGTIVENKIPRQLAWSQRGILRRENYAAASSSRSVKKFHQASAMRRAPRLIT